MSIYSRERRWLFAILSYRIPDIQRVAGCKQYNLPRFGRRVTSKLLGNQIGTPRVKSLIFAPRAALRTLAKV